MKEVIAFKGEEPEGVLLSTLSKHTPIFAKYDGRIVGMIVKEPNGWILRLGGSRGCTGHHSSRKECLLKSRDFRGYTFWMGS